MRRIAYFLYYCYALQWRVQDTYIFSIPLAWNLAGIAARARKWDDQARTTDFFTSLPSTGKEPYEDFGEWCAKHGYDVDDDAQMQAAIEAYTEGGDAHK